MFLLGSKLHYLGDFLGSERSEDVMSLFPNSVMDGTTLEQNRVSIRKPCWENQRNYRHKNPSVQETIGRMHRHLHSCIAFWLLLQCLQQLGSFNIWWISAELHWLLTPAIQTNPCSALCNQPCPGKTISFPNDRQTETHLTGLTRHLWDLQRWKHGGRGQWNYKQKAPKVNCTGMSTSSTS